MRALSFTLAVLSLSLLAPACRHRSETPGATTPEQEAPVKPHLPPGTRVETWPYLGASSAKGIELPGSRDPFLWEGRATSVPPKAQIPHRLHRPVE
jgi:hypothetical protein